MRINANLPLFCGLKSELLTTKKISHKKTKKFRNDLEISIYKRNLNCKQRTYKLIAIKDFIQKNYKNINAHTQRHVALHLHMLHTIIHLNKYCNTVRYCAKQKIFITL